MTTRLRLLSGFVATSVAFALLGACGDDSPGVEPGTAASSTGAAAAGGAAVEVIDDAAIVRRVFAAAVDGDSAALAELELPPRVSRVRVGVHALHDVLLERRAGLPSLTALLDALDALAGASGGADAQALAPLVAAWRTWDETQIAIEAELARQMTIATTSQSLPKPPGVEGLRLILGKIGEAGSPPPSSPAGAGAQVLRVAILALSDPGDGIGVELQAEIAAAVKAFTELSWPGGLAAYLEPLSGHLLRASPDGVRGNVLWATAADAYVASKDPVASARMYLDRAATVQMTGDLQRAERLAFTARARLEKAGAGGGELVDALGIHATLIQALGRHEDVLEPTERALAEAATLPHAVELTMSLARVRAASLVRVGRFAEAIELATSAGAAYDAAVDDPTGSDLVIRAELAATAGAAALEAERPVEARSFFSLAADLHGRRGTGPDATREQTIARLLAARSQLRAGDTAGAQSAVRDLIGGRQHAAGALALAADVLLEAGDTEGAQTIVRQATAALGTGNAHALSELRARIALAEDRPITDVRPLFAGAERYLTRGRFGAFGWRVASVLDRWAAAEEHAGDRRRAVEILLRAEGHLAGGDAPVQRDRIQARLMRLQRERGWFHAAREWGERRLASGALTDDADGRLDLLLVYLELAAAGEVPPVIAGAAPAEPFLSRARRLAASDRDPERGARLLAGIDGKSPPSEAQDPRIADLLAIPHASADVARRLAEKNGVDQPELRRLAARRGLLNVGPDDHGLAFQLLEHRRTCWKMDLERTRKACAPGQVYLAVEPCGDFTAVMTVAADGSTFRLAGPSTPLRDLWDAAHVEPSRERIEVTAKAVGELLAPELASVPQGATLGIGMAPPMGPLPWDLVPVGDGLLLDRCAVVTASEANEAFSGHFVPDHAGPTLFPADAGERRLNMLVPAALPLPPDAMQAALSVLGATPSGDASFAHQLAARKRKLRASSPWPSNPPRVPAWAGVQLRGRLLD